MSDIGSPTSKPVAFLAVRRNSIFDRYFVHARLGEKERPVSMDSIAIVSESSKQDPTAWSGRTFRQPSKQIYPEGTHDPVSPPVCRGCQFEGPSVSAVDALDVWWSERLTRRLLSILHHECDRCLLHGNLLSHALTNSEKGTDSRWFIVHSGCGSRCPDVN